MINLTNNQVIAFNKLFLLNEYDNPNKKNCHITCKISIGVISLIINHKRYYHIRKNRIECKTYKYGKKNKIYNYKLKKR